MTDPMVWDHLLAAFRGVFTSFSFAIFLCLSCAWALCPGRHTITRLYVIAEPAREKAHDAYHRFFREGAWSMAALWKTLARILVAMLYQKKPIPLDLDDTLFHRCGRKVKGAAWWRDAVRSTGQKVVHAFGLNLVVLTLRIDPPWGGEPLGLPVNMRLHRKHGPNLLELAEEMVEEFISWFSSRQFELCGDGFFAPMTGLLPARVRFTSRMRKDAALYEAPPERRKGQRGRPRKKGKRLPTPEQMAWDPAGWRLVETSERGKRKQRLVKVGDVLWYKVLPNRLVRLVISCDPLGKERDDFFFTTDLEAQPESVVSRYAGRWSIEDTFKNVKQYLGGQDPQSWKNKGPERTAAFSFWLYSVIWCWYIKTGSNRQTWKACSWYPQKRTPSFIDALAHLRRTLWGKRVFSNSEKTAGATKIPDEIIEVLAHAA